MTVRTKCNLGIFPEGRVHTASHQAEATEQTEDANLWCLASLASVRCCQPQLTFSVTTQLLYSQMKQRLWIKACNCQFRTQMERGYLWTAVLGTAHCLFLSHRNNNSNPSKRWGKPLGTVTSWLSRSATRASNINRNHPSTDYNHLQGEYIIIFLLISELLANYIDQIARDRTRKSPSPWSICQQEKSMFSSQCCQRGNHTRFKQALAWWGRKAPTNHEPPELEVQNCHILR